MDNAPFILTLVTIALFAPLVGSAVVLLSTRRLIFKMAGPITTGILGFAFLCSLTAAVSWSGSESPQPIVANVPWIPLGGSGWLYLGVMIDSLTIAMVTMVTLIATLVHLYSMGYMEGDPRYNRFFGYLSLFTFSMMGIVTANSILMLFVFWELVGMTSYLLIGFWFEKRGPQLACKKAFVMNRVGDMGFLIGFGILFWHLGGKVLLPAAGGDGSMFHAIAAELGGAEAIVNNPPMWLTAAGIGLFFGAIGKSAQFPLQTWLPDAMEGPTPVSSIVHSATMVAAGVYLTGRIYPILTPGAHLFIATIGLVTLVMAACMALVMTDIKRVLAYSTLSQLGYMILGLGTGAYTFALFHLITHAFFKCCLFQCAGSVINGAHHQQDMRYYGGLHKKMPVTAACYGVCTLAIAGASLPFTNIGISGFYSKDGIIAGAVNYGHALAHDGWWAAPLFYWGPICVAYLTVFYMARSFALTFLGKPRDQHLYDHAHEAPKTMLASQVVLAAMAVLTVPAILPFFKLIKSSSPVIDWVQPGAWGHHAGESMYHGFHMTHGALLYGFGWILALGLGIGMYRPGFAMASKIAAVPGINILYTWTKNKFYFDALYDSFAVSLGKAVAAVMSWVDKYLVDGLVNLCGIAFKGWAAGVGSFDRRVVDGAVNGAASMAQASGEMLRVTQAGRVRGYVLLLVTTATVVSLVVITVVLAQTP